jgi:hypothetical protein
MNDTPRTPLHVDELVSYAHRAGDEVRVSLRLANGAVAPGAVEVRLVNDRRKFEVSGNATAENDATVVTFSAPQERLGRAVWRLAVRGTGGEKFHRVEARLLAKGSQPVALLPGPTPTTRMAPPRPRPKVSTVRRVAAQLPEPAKQVLRRGRAVVAGRRRG